MATRERRLAEFDSEEPPPEGRKMELLCQDNSGTYLLPFLCVHTKGRWSNAGTGEAIDAEVVGWRTPRGG